MVIAASFISLANFAMTAAGLSMEFVAINWWGLLFFVVLTLITFQFAGAGVTQKSHSRFFTYVFGSMTIKFFICITAVVAYYIVIKPGNMLTILSFFVMYIIFAVIETVCLVKLSKSKV